MEAIKTTTKAILKGVTSPLLNKRMTKYYLAGMIGLAICVALVVIQQIAKKTPVLLIDEESSLRNVVGWPGKSNPVTHDEAVILFDDWIHELEIAVATQRHSFQIITKWEPGALRRPTWRLWFHYQAPSPTADLTMDTFLVSWDLGGPGEAHFRGLDCLFGNLS